MQGFAQGFPACTKLRRAFSSVAQSGGPLSRRSVVQVHERPPTRSQSFGLARDVLSLSGPVSAASTLRKPAAFHFRSTAS